MTMIKKLTGILLLLSIAVCTAVAAAEPYISQEGAQFGMMPADIRKIEEARDNPLKDTYFSDDAYEMYYETDIRFHSLNCIRMEYDFALNDQQLYQLYYVTTGGEADYLFALDLFTREYGQPVTDPDDEETYSHLYESCGKGTDHIEAAHWLPENTDDPGVDLWYDDSDIVFIAFYDPKNPASYGEYPDNYAEWPAEELPGR